MTARRATTRSVAVRTPTTRPRLDVDADDLGVAVQLTPTGGEPAGQGLRESARAALGHGEADRLAQHGHQQAHQPGARGVERDVRVAGVARHQDRWRDATEALRTELGGRRQQHAYETQPAHPAQSGEQAERRADRWERRQQRADQLIAHGVPLRAQLQPGVAVARVLGVGEPRGHVSVAMQQRPAAVDERMAEHRRSVPPGQPVLLEPQRLNGARRGSQRVERAEGVVHEAGVNVLSTRDRPADRRLCLQHQDRPPAVGEQVRSDQAVGARPDDDRVVPGHATGC